MVSVGIAFNTTPPLILPPRTPPSTEPGLTNGQLLDNLKSSARGTDDRSWHDFWQVTPDASKPDRNQNLLADSLRPVDAGHLGEEGVDPVLDSCSIHPDVLGDTPSTTRADLGECVGQQRGHRDVVDVGEECLPHDHGRWSFPMCDDEDHRDPFFAFCDDITKKLDQVRMGMQEEMRRVNEIADVIRTAAAAPHIFSPTMERHAVPPTMEKQAVPPTMEKQAARLNWRNSLDSATTAQSMFGSEGPFESQRSETTVGPTVIHTSTDFADLVPESRTDMILIVDTVMGFVTTASCCVLGISLDVGQRAVWFLVDIVFAILFSCESLWRLTYFGWHDFAWGPDCRWNLFELALVIVGWAELLFEAFGSQLLELSGFYFLFRSIKIVRVARLIKVLRVKFFYELKVMVLGTVGGMRTLMWSAVLVFWPVYMVSLLFRVILGEADAEVSIYFTDMPSSLFTLSRCVVLGDCADSAGRPLLVHILEEFGWACAAIYGLLHVFITFGLFNVVTALYVESVVAAAKCNDVLNRKHRLRDKQYFDSKMYDLIGLLWEAWLKKSPGGERMRLSAAWDDPAAVAAQRMVNMEITPDLIGDIQGTPRFQEIMNELDVADDDHFDLFEVLDADNSGTLDIQRLRQGIGRLRGGARRGDAVAIRTLIEEVLDEVRNLKDSHNYTDGAQDCNIHHMSRDES